MNTEENVDAELNLASPKSKKRKISQPTTTDAIATTTQNSETATALQKAVAMHSNSEGPRFLEFFQNILEQVFRAIKNSYILAIISEYKQSKSKQPFIISNF